MTIRQKSLVRSVSAAIESMHWITDADEAAVQMALSYAASIQAAKQSGRADVIVKAHYLGPHLMNALRELGGTPLGRKALEAGGDEDDDQALATIEAEIAAATKQ